MVWIPAEYPLPASAVKSPESLCLFRALCWRFSGRRYPFKSKRSSRARFEALHSELSSDCEFSDNSRHLGSCTLNASHSGVEVNDDELFLQATGGVNNKGLVYGLGNQTQAYYERVGPSAQSSPSTPIAYAPSMYTQIKSSSMPQEKSLLGRRSKLSKLKMPLLGLSLALGARALRFPLLPDPYS
ncbi:hypothetical protein Cgig2_025433 [Carnegiea gigantea]|uniref:Uncharacterized protein n=1 Tax=Carnegiea gigantea TaxID=171969 RepID=A0A9Q1KM62_9CARY|nr:hypothetical protein Cgig2_025433 [Carnegiea gigantea]